jgi:hypothetical protein
MTIPNRLKFSVLLSLLLTSTGLFAQSQKPNSYIISKNETYTIDVRYNQPGIELFSEEKKWIGDRDDSRIKGNRINYSTAFENVTDVEAYSISPDKKKLKVRDIRTADVEIEDIFYHDMKYKYYYFDGLIEGSETYSSFRKQYRKPQLLDKFYFKDDLACHDSRISLKISKDVEIGYVLHGEGTDKIAFTSSTDGNYNIYNWELKNSEKEEPFDEAPPISYYSPHLIFYIKSYKNNNGVQKVLGSVEDLYKFYYETTKDINKSDETVLKAKTDELTKGFSNDFNKAKAIFDYVQGSINYVAFEDGMGGYVPREAAEVFQKKYGDCKDMANLLNEMLNHAGIESHISWIGTRHNNYTYEKVPTPIADNHMIAVAKIADEYYFLDATGHFCIFPNPTPFIQGKEALLRIDADHYKILNVPVITPENNNTAAKIRFAFEGSSIKGSADFALTGFAKSEFVGHFNSVIEKNEMLKKYMSRFIDRISTSKITVGNNDLLPTPATIKSEFAIDKWVRNIDGKLMFKPILFFPFSDSRIDTVKRNVPYQFDFRKSYDFNYEFEIPEGYAAEFIPDNFKLDTKLVSAAISYKQDGNKLIISQAMSLHTILLNHSDFEMWNTAIKSITKYYNQNIILAKK